MMLQLDEGLHDTRVRIEPPGKLSFDVHEPRAVSDPRAGIDLAALESGDDGSELCGKGVAKSPGA